MAYYQEYASTIDGAPCIAVWTLGSTNTKTGSMVQVWFLRRDVEPTEAIETGADGSICGDCPLKRSLCYVTVFRAPLAIWRAYKRGSYVKLDLGNPRHVADLRSAPIRFGAYGEPASLPWWWWRDFFWLAVKPRAWTGYTHRWRESPEYRAILMASVETAIDAREAQRAGWRTFRIRRPDQETEPGEFACPASEEAGHRLQCIDCKACDGLKMREMTPRANVAIVAHGSGAARF